jgi:hypothetical protein
MKYQYIHKGKENDEILKKVNTVNVKKTYIPSNVQKTSPLKKKL